MAAQPINSQPLAPKPNQKPGLRFGEFRRAIDIIIDLGISKDTWSLWKKAGLKTFKPGTESEFILTDVVIEFMMSEPDLSERPSVTRAREREQRKKRPG